MSPAASGRPVVAIRGAWSSQRHVHNADDELLVMLEGEAVLIEDTQQVVGVLDRSAGERESAFKARLQCAPAATPIVSAALGEYAAAFDLPSLVISDAKQGLAVESAADASAIASPRL